MRDIAHRTTVPAAMALVAASVVLLAYKGARSYAAQSDYFGDLRHAVPALASTDSLRLDEVAFAGLDGDIRGWIAPSHNAAGIVLVHGSLNDRRALLPEARVLQEAGYGVLLFDVPGHGESNGSATWADNAPAALGAALSFMAAQPSVDAARVGVVGFSMGGFLTAQVAATDERIKAAALLAPVHDQAEWVRHNFGSWGPVTHWPAMLAMEAAGLARDDLPPITTIAAVAPRALMFVTSPADTAVPTEFVRRMFETAGHPKHLLSIEGAGHGGYMDAAPRFFASSLIDFFDTHLIRGAAPLASQ